MALQGLSAEAEEVSRTLFTNVHLFDGMNEHCIENANVLVEGKAVSTDTIAAEGAAVMTGAAGV